MKQLCFNIDVVGSCNLRCPSCPMGGPDTNSRTTGVMSPSLLQNILQKASRECELVHVGLFNWAEPLIHPKLPELIEITEFHAPCHLSSNLNLPKTDYEALLKTNPRYFRISVSGFNQNVYSKTHRGGDIEVVKKNMAALANAAEKTGSKTIIEVHYLRYLGNADDEFLMREYAKTLGFSFQPVWTFLMPLERIVDYVRKPGQVSQDDRQLVEMLTLPPSADVIQAARSVKSSRCTLLEDQITLNCRGDVQLCCGTFDEQKYTICRFLDVPLDEIQNQKREIQFCQECMSLGLHDLGVLSSPKFDRIAKKSVLSRYQELVYVEQPSVLERLKNRVRRLMRP